MSDRTLNLLLLPSWVLCLKCDHEHRPGACVHLSFYIYIFEGAFNIAVSHSFGPLAHTQAMFMATGVVVCSVKLLMTTEVNAQWVDSLKNIY